MATKSKVTAQPAPSQKESQVKKPNLPKKTQASESEGEKKGKIVGPKPKPKKGKTAYLYYTLEARQELAKSNPGLKGKEVLTEIGKNWTALSENEKEPYKELASKDKERYERQMAELERTGIFHDEDGNEVTEIPKKKRSKSPKENDAGGKRKSVPKKTKK